MERAKLPSLTCKIAKACFYKVWKFNWKILQWQKHVTRLWIHARVRVAVNERGSLADPRVLFRAYSILQDTTYKLDVLIYLTDSKISFQHHRQIFALIPMLKGEISFGWETYLHVLCSLQKSFVQISRSVVFLQVYLEIYVSFPQNLRKKNQLSCYNFITIKFGERKRSESNRACKI